MNLTTTLEFVMRDCSSSTLLKQCNLLPQCYACLVNAASIYDMDYYLKLFSVDDQDYHFTYVDTSTPHYFTCVRGQESQACGEVMEFVDANYRTVTKRPLSEVLVSLYAVVCCCAGGSDRVAGSERLVRHPPGDAGGVGAVGAVPDGPVPVHLRHAQSAGGGRRVQCLFNKENTGRASSDAVSVPTWR